MNLNIRSIWQRSTPIKIAVALYLVALIIRYCFLFESHQLLEFRTPTPGLDTCLHWEGAKQIRAGADPALELMLPSAPLHPFVVALNQVIFGESMLRHRIARATTSSFTIVFVFLSVLRITSRRGAAIAAAIVGLTLPSWIYFDTMIIKVSVEIVMLSLVVWLALQQHDGWPAKRFFLLGLLLGVCLSILRFSQGGTLLYVVILAIYFLIRRNYATPWKKLLVVVPMVLLMVGSQLGFKHREQLFGIPANNFLPVGGVHMRIGFQHNAIGTYHVLRRFPALPLGHTFFSRMCAEAKEGREMTPAEANQTYIDESLDFIRENPGETVEILFRKFGIFFNNFEASANHYLYYLQDKVFWLNLPTIGYGGVVLLAFWGIIALWREKKYATLFLLGGLVCSVLTSNLLSFVTWRYRIHTTLPMVMLAGPGMLFIYRQIAAWKTRGVGRTVLVLLGMMFVTSPVAWLAYRDVLPNARAMMVSTSEKNLAQSRRAERYDAQLKLMAKKEQLTPKEMEQRATILHRLGRYTESYQQLKIIAETMPAKSIPASRQFLVYEMWQGKYNEVVDYLAMLSVEHPWTYGKVINSFDTDSGFWEGSDNNLRLIMQTLIRDIVIPRLLAKGVPLPPKEPQEDAEKKN